MTRWRALGGDIVDPFDNRIGLRDAIELARMWALKFAFLRPFRPGRAALYRRGARDLCNACDAALAWRRAAGWSDEKLRRCA